MKRYRILTAARALSVAAMLGFGTLAVAAPARASEPQPAPTGLEVLHVDDTSAEMDWGSACFSTEDVVQRLVNGSWQTYATGICEYLKLTGLTPGTTYTFRVYSAAVPDIDMAQSPPTAPISFTTLSGPDSAPPSTPAEPTFSSVTTTVADVFWPQSTDNVQVTGYYLQELVSGGWTTIRTVDASGNFQTISGLTPATAYSFAVIAFDARGNNSPRSDTGTVTTLAVTATPSCQITLQSYGGGFFLVEASVLNTTARPITGWHLDFSLASTVTTSSVFGGTLTRSGNSAALVPASWNTTISPGYQVYAGFMGSSNPPAPPSGFTFNGLPCTGA